MNVAQHIDSFDRATLGQDTIYTNDSAFAGHTGMEIVGGKARSKVNSLDGYAELLTPVFPANQWAEILIGTMNGSGTDGSVQIVLRYTPGGGTSVGFLIVAFPSGVTQCYDNVTGGGPIIDIAVTPWVAGDKFRVEIVENLLKIFMNDVLVSSGSSIAPVIAGQPGMVINTSDITNTEIARFRAGWFEGLSRWNRPAPFKPGSPDKLR